MAVPFAEKVLLVQGNDVMPISCLEASVVINKYAPAIDNFDSIKTVLSKVAHLTKLAQGGRNYCSNAATSNEQCLHVLAAHIGDIE